MAAPAMSSGRPMRLHRAPRRRSASPKASRVAAIIFDSKGPGAMALTVIRGRASAPGGASAGGRPPWTPSRSTSRATGTWMPSMDPMLMTRAGSSVGRGRARSRGSRNFVVWNTPFTLSDSTRSHAASSNCSKGAPPRVARVVHEDVRGAPRVGRRHPPGPDTRPRWTGRRRASRIDPRLASSVAAASHASALRDDTYDLAPRRPRTRRRSSADAARAAGDERGLAGDGEQVCHAVAPRTAGPRRYRPARAGAIGGGTRGGGDVASRRLTMPDGADGRRAGSRRLGARAPRLHPAALTHRWPRSAGSRGSRSTALPTASRPRRTRRRARHPTPPSRAGRRTGRGTRAPAAGCTWPPSR